ncbi:hypothetical protein [Streptomyces sp. NPDC005209]|uniref:hypothetical protein n=1 Tax=Streptomyces sp. NPDC005209 TaxID=3156715 RepID=UPI0033BC5A49
MSGRTDSDVRPGIAEVAETAEVDDMDDSGDMDDVDDVADHAEDARRARWVATGTGVLLTLAGLAAALLRLTGSKPVVVPAAYAVGAGVCALAAVLGARGRTRRALWLLVAGTMIMALGDQFD